MRKPLPAHRVCLYSLWDADDHTLGDIPYREGYNNFLDSFNHRPIGSFIEFHMDMGNQKLRHVIQKLFTPN